MNNKLTIIKTLLNNQHNIKGNQDLEIRPENWNLGSLKLKMSGRIRGVSMARVLHFTSNIKKTAGIVDEEKKPWNKGKNEYYKTKKISNFNKIKSWKSPILNKNMQTTANSSLRLPVSINNTNTAVKPQTLNSISTYRLQYIQKDVYTKWGIIGIKIWLYNTA